MSTKLAPFEKLLPVTPDGWTEYGQAIQTWWRSTPGLSQEHIDEEQLPHLEHIVIHVRQYPLRLRKIPLEEQEDGVDGDMSLGDMPLLEQRMREAGIRLVTCRRVGC